MLIVSVVLSMHSPDRFLELLRSEDINIKFSAVDSLYTYYDQDENYHRDSLYKYSELYYKYGLELGNLFVVDVKPATIYAGYLFEDNQIEKGDSVLDMLLSFKDKYDPRSNNLARVYSKLAYRSNLMNDYVSKAKYYELAHDNYNDNKVILKADSKLYAGHSYSSIGNFIKAMNCYELAYEYYELEKDTTYMIGTKSSIIVLFSQNRMYDKVDEEYSKIEKIISKNPLPFSKMIMHYNRSLDAKKQNKLDDIEYHLKNAQQTPEYLENKNSYYNSLLNSELVHYYGRVGEGDSVTYYMNLIWQDQKNNKSNPRFDEISLHAESYYYYYFGQYEEALKSLLEHKKISAKADVERRIEILRKLAKTYEKLGQYEKSQKTYLDYINLKDSTFNNSMATSLMYYQTKFETKLKEKEIETKTAQLELEKKKNDQRKNQLIGLLLASCLLYGIYTIYQSKRQAQKEKLAQEKFSVQLLEETENEKKRISQSLHDGIGQNLLVIRNKLSKSSQNGITKIIDNTIKEVRGISQGLHPIQLEQLGLTGAIINTLSNTQEITDTYVTYDVQNIDQKFSKLEEIHIFRTVQEIINNVVKHSKADALNVQIKNLKSSILLIFEDNGKGFEFSKELNKIGSLGLKTIKERIKVLGGSIEYITSINKGTITTINIPL